MRCPSCKAQNKDRVVDSRATQGAAVIRRRRECMACGRRFTTKERVEEELRLVVTKRDGSREPYEREKVMRGILRASYKLPIDEDRIEHLVDDVEEDIFANHDREVSSEQIGEFIIRRLRDLNHVAYVRFMAVYRQYRDVAEFVDEIQNVKELAATQVPNQQTLFDG